MMRVALARHMKRELLESEQERLTKVYGVQYFFMFFHIFFFLGGHIKSNFALLRTPFLFLPLFFLFTSSCVVLLCTVAVSI